jgi:RHS repeat-associated protein
MESGVEFGCNTPFGSEWTTDVLGTDQKLRFTGHERDLMNPSYTTDDLDWMHARHYNLNLGRFLSVDPAPADPMRPQSWNAYAYVLNNPLKFTDPFGLSATPCYQDSVAGDQPCFQEEISVNGNNPSFDLGLDYYSLASRSAGESFDGQAQEVYSKPKFTVLVGGAATGGFGVAGQVEVGVYWNPVDWGIYGLYGFGAGFGGAIGGTVGGVEGGADNVAGEYIEGQIATPFIGLSGFADAADTTSIIPPVFGGAFSPPGGGVGSGFFLTKNHALRVSIPETNRRVDSFLLRAMKAFTDPRQWGF